MRHRRKNPPHLTTVRLMNKFHESGGEYYMDPDDAKMLARIKKDLADARREEPKFGWHLETRGTHATWHRWEGMNPYSKKSRYRHSRLKSKSRYDKRSFRTIKIGKHGKLLRVGCPKGRWKRGRCSVGMKAQGLLTPKRYAKLLRLTRWRGSRKLAANRRRN